MARALVECIAFNQCLEWPEVEDGAAHLLSYLSHFRNLAVSQPFRVSTQPTTRAP